MTDDVERAVERGANDIVRSLENLVTAIEKATTRIETAVVHLSDSVVNEIAYRTPHPMVFASLVFATKKCSPSEAVKQGVALAQAWNEHVKQHAAASGRPGAPRLVRGDGDGEEEASTEDGS